MSDDRDDHRNNPIEENPGSTPYSSPVIDFAQVRVAFGLPKFHNKICRHRRLTYNPSERRVWCQDCESTVDNFDAFMTITSHFHDMERAAQAKLTRAAEAEKATLVKKATKNIDRAWNRQRPMAICCTHCGGGLLPEDYESGGSAVSRDIELARRKRLKAEKETK
ncbi:hypothetical protein GR212_15480 [Rhizobium lusitanum]|uniref:Uncharacterized protein n=1 Tax=Rhizobium lusitanum TaxID=293958 RepID=A0A6L9U666_9HYPH|nr:hypothetical protein [Rhizobium lusitanum]NEI70981.1 hypothetical protein [Rhizobium lusitanum]